MENLTAQIDDNNIEGEVRWQRNVTAKPVTNQAARDAAARVKTWMRLYDFQYITYFFSIFCIYPDDI